VVLTGLASDFILIREMGCLQLITPCFEGIAFYELRIGYNLSECWMSALFCQLRFGEIVDMPLIKARFETLAPLLRWRLYTTARFLELFV
jgi:hypothetical protein